MQSLYLCNCDAINIWKGSYVPFTKRLQTVVKYHGSRILVLLNSALVTLRLTRYVTHLKIGVDWCVLKHVTQILQRI